MMKIRSILTGIAISLSLAGMAQSQYDGAPVNRSANETSTDNVEVRKNKYPRSDNDWENFNVLHINRLPSAVRMNDRWTSSKKDMMFQVGMILKFLPIGNFKGSAILFM